MAQTYTTGAAHIFLGLPGAAGMIGTPGGPAGSAATPAYLGTCERSPRISKRRYYRPVWNSLGGSDIPYERLYQGQDAFVMLNLTRYNWATLTGLESSPHTFAQGNGPMGIPDGYNLVSDTGTAMLLEGCTLPLYVNYPYVSKSVYGNNGMPAGDRFIAAQLENPEDLDNLNTEAVSVRLIFYCARQLIQVSQSSPLNWVTYDHYMGNLPSIVPPN